MENKCNTLITVIQISYVCVGGVNLSGLLDQPSVVTCVFLSLLVLAFILIAHRVRQSQCSYLFNCAPYLSLLLESQRCRAIYLSIPSVRVRPGEPLLSRKATQRRTRGDDNHPLLSALAHNCLTTAQRSCD